MRLNSFQLTRGISPYGGAHSRCVVRTTTTSRPPRASGEPEMPGGHRRARRIVSGAVTIQNRDGYIHGEQAVACDNRRPNS